MERNTIIDAQFYNWYRSPGYQQTLEMVAQQRARQEQIAKEHAELLTSELKPEDWPL